MIHNIKKNFAEFFNTKESQKEIEAIQEKTEEIASKIDQEFVAMNCSEALPCFEFEINLNEADWLDSLSWLFYII